ncbi:TPA: DUF4145 domain-containing protein [Burkholderia vietnamiensis]|uniref:DUF4145 domain-containing protein n=1 Tax=Burkholderia vietnamiensis TaxID=60552 RepID=A0AA44XXM5_BURVI|nr:DUF4145 domain-containing protein [Burkholderia vietnamiensis]HDR9103155.1 DUF4145 domain-containing protein [Burkholderia vietnamiensis]HDR9122883.1 DUF4145 domain-containing protein [Burkholderia vietnamiensis]HDR9172701.1 DUF4145 domain-containing protein [Burkholderia vietnamiensis]HDR9284850.1 DUF4145 domain-containing protein [Burkholderia vietnamiensis]
MATINQNGHVQARCPTCSGALTSFQIGDPQRGHYGQLFRELEGGGVEIYRLACCSGCGAGALITLLNDGRYTTLEDFYPEAEERQPLPANVPDGIVNEFREGEECAEAGCYRAAAALFRSVLDKTLRANGYKLKKGTPLEQQIDLAAEDGVITASRRKRAHDEIRTLGNDVLHDEWRKVVPEEVQTAKDYAARLLHDFYDDRETVLSVLRAKGRVSDDDKAVERDTD